MKSKKIIDCPHCCHFNKELKKCERIGEVGINKGKQGICWMNPSEGEYLLMTTYEFIKEYENAITELRLINMTRYNIFKKWYTLNNDKTIEEFIIDISNDIDSVRLTKLFNRYSVLIDYNIDERDGERLFNVLIDTIVTLKKYEIRSEL